MEDANETYFEAYKDALEEILNDRFLKELHIDETNARNDIRKELSQFQAKLGELVIKLKAGKSLKGECDAED